MAAPAAPVAHRVDQLCSDASAALTPISHNATDLEEPRILQQDPIMGLDPAHDPPIDPSN
jgi:hypothetical protein